MRRYATVFSGRKAYRMGRLLRGLPAGGGRRCPGLNVFAERCCSRVQRKVCRAHALLAPRTSLRLPAGRIFLRKSVSLRSVFMPRRQSASHAAYAEVAEYFRPCCRSVSDAPCVEPVRPAWSAAGRMDARCAVAGGSALDSFRLPFLLWRSGSCAARALAGDGSGLAGHCCMRSTVRGHRRLAGQAGDAFRSSADRALPAIGVLSGKGRANVFRCAGRGRLRGRFALRLRESRASSDGSVTANRRFTLRAQARKTG